MTAGLGINGSPIIKICSVRVGKMKCHPNLCPFSDGHFEGNSLNEMKINMLFLKGNSLSENQILTMNSVNIDYFVFNCNLLKKK